MLVHVCSLPKIENEPLPGPSAVVCMADSPALLAKIKDEANVAARLDLVFNDSADDFGLVRSATDADALRILQFVDAHKATVPNIVFQCQVGVGRSLAAYAACLRLYGGDPRPALHQGTHNRNLYRRMLGVAGFQPEPEPRVSMVVRLKYAPDRMVAFILAMQRQRYDNWELIFVTDGPFPAAHQAVANVGDPRITVLGTERPMGHWGHPYRQRGMDAATGDWIGLSNDDNYYAPGYFEQMMNAAKGEDADLVLCSMLHSYAGWASLEPGHDLGSWIARRELVKATPWEGDDFAADARHVARLKANAKRIATVTRPLFIHN
jgi:predicted protein tyrosine phosphatase